MVQRIWATSARVMLRSPAKLPSALPVVDHLAIGVGLRQVRDALHGDGVIHPLGRHRAVQDGHHLKPGGGPGHVVKGKDRAVNNALLHAVVIGRLVPGGAAAGGSLAVGLSVDSGRQGHGLRQGQGILGAVGSIGQALDQAGVVGRFHSRAEPPALLHIGEGEGVEDCRPGRAAAEPGGGEDRPLGGGGDGLRLALLPGIGVLAGDGGGDAAVGGHGHLAGGRAHLKACVPAGDGDLVPGVVQLFGDHGDGLLPGGGGGGGDRLVRDGDGVELGGLHAGVDAAGDHLDHRVGGGEGDGQAPGVGIVQLIAVDRVLRAVDADAPQGQVAGGLAVLDSGGPAVGGGNGEVAHSGGQRGPAGLGIGGGGVRAALKDGLEVAGIVVLGTCFQGHDVFQLRIGIVGGEGVGQAAGAAEFGGAAADGQGDIHAGEIGVPDGDAAVACALGHNGVAAGGGVEAQQAVTAAALDVGEEPAVPGGQVRLAQIALLVVIGGVGHLGEHIEVDQIPDVIALVGRGQVPQALGPGLEHAHIQRLALLHGVDGGHSEAGAAPLGALAVLPDVVLVVGGFAADQVLEVPVADVVVIKILLAVVEAEIVLVRKGRVPDGVEGHILRDRHGAAVPEDTVLGGPALQGVADIGAERIEGGLPAVGDGLGLNGLEKCRAVPVVGDGAVLPCGRDPAGGKSDLLVKDGGGGGLGHALEVRDNLLDVVVPQLAPQVKALREDEPAVKGIAGPGDSGELCLAVLTGVQPANLAVAVNADACGPGGLELRVVVVLAQEHIPAVSANFRNQTAVGEEINAQGLALGGVLNPVSPENHLVAGPDTAALAPEGGEVRFFRRLGPAD